MGDISSQVLATWIKEDIDSTEWMLLRELAHASIRNRVTRLSSEEAWEQVEIKLTFVANHLRDEAATARDDGSILSFEIDEEESPYIRLVRSAPAGLLAKLRRIHPSEFEKVCAKILTALGSSSEVTQTAHDGGIDFIGRNLNIVPSALRVPLSCYAIVLGQAKRYADGRLIGETRLREFLGAAAMRRHTLHRESKLSLYAPVLLAFWTTSDFEPNAKRFARSAGIWAMNGTTLSAYVTHLQIYDFVMALPDG